MLTLANADPATLDDPYRRQGIACVFEKPSARTRNSTEMAVVQLGGHPVYITANEVGIDTRADQPKTLPARWRCFHDVICARVFSHAVLERMAGLNLVPIVSLLSDVSHPLQAIAGVAHYRGRVRCCRQTDHHLHRRRQQCCSLARSCGHQAWWGVPHRIARGLHLQHSRPRRFRATKTTITVGQRPADVLGGSDVSTPTRGPRWAKKPNVTNAWPICGLRHRQRHDVRRTGCHFHALSARSSRRRSCR
ncbi:MAG: hypothetical protein R2706_12480 [Acidimicrobiales bacterium]